uniref:Uncharacterized protein n=1 Tax=Ditylenchus dipsaci TaxID=166011 RepID=A0A915E3S1_9BILA
MFNCTNVSGSASPLSVNVLSAGSGSGAHSSRPEGFAQPSPKLSPQTVSTNQSDSKDHSLLFNELLAYLPVKANLQSPVQVTFELHPSPQVDAQLKHL